MRQLKFDEVESVILEEKRNNRTIGLSRTTGGLHNGHLELYRQSKKYCDCLILIFVHFLYRLYPMSGNYENCLETDLKLLEDIADYVIVVPWSESIDNNYKEFYRKCVIDFDWDPYKREDKYFSIEKFRDRFITGSIPLSFEEALWGCDIFIASEKSAFTITLCQKLSVKIYNDGTPYVLYFPVTRVNGTSIDSTDRDLVNYDSKIKFGEIIKDIKKLVTKDLSCKEIIEYTKDKLPKNTSVLQMTFWSPGKINEPLLMSERLSKCKPENFLTIYGEIKCSILSMIYQVENLAYNEDSLFDSSGNFLLNI